MVTSIKVQTRWFLERWSSPSLHTLSYRFRLNGRILLQSSYQQLLPPPFAPGLMQIVPLSLCITFLLMFRQLNYPGSDTMHFVKEYKLGATMGLTEWGLDISLQPFRRQGGVSVRRLAALRWSRVHRVPTMHL